MRFRTLAIASVILLLAASGAFAAYSISEDARAESDQQTVERNDSLAVEPGYRQALVSDEDHYPTSYGENGTETVEYNGTVWEPGPDNYTYYPSTGELEFNRNETGEANVTYQYDVPADQARDEQLRVGTRGLGTILRFGAGLSLVGVFVFIGGFFARRMGVFGGSNRGRGR
jgi:hypothetical protein